jgi:hypothetical protein
VTYIRPGPRPPSFGRRQADLDRAEAAQPSLADLEAATEVYWRDLAPDLSPWFMIGLAYMPGEVPHVALRVVEDAHSMPAEVIAPAEMMLTVAHAIIAACGVASRPAAGYGEVAQRRAG